MCFSNQRLNFASCAGFLRSRPRHRQTHGRSGASELIKSKSVYSASELNRVIKSLL